LVKLIAYELIFLLSCIIKSQISPSFSLGFNLTSLNKITKGESVSMYESIKETVKSNEKQIIDAAPSDFTTFVNVSAISTPVQTDSPLTPPITTTTSTITSKVTTITSEKIGRTLLIHSFVYFQFRE
jgi:hypothetical protein